jgi:hypothetical protein
VAMNSDEQRIRPSGGPYNAEDLFDDGP